MAGITHTKVSGKADGADATLVLPSDWNADHAVGDLGGTPNVSFATTSAAGNATTYLRTNDQLTLFDATSPSTQAFGDSAAVGVASTAARRDHKHAMPAAPTTIANDTLWAAKGNLAVATANDTAAVLVPPTSRAQVLGSDEAGNVSWVSGAAGKNNGIRIADDFLYFMNLTVASHPSWMVGPGTSVISGTAATFAVLAGTVPQHPGIYQFGTGSTSLGTCRLVVGGTGAWELGAGRARFGAWVRIPVVSTSAQRFEVTCGFIDNTTTAGAVDGCFFTYSDTINSGVWSVTTVANSVSTATLNITTGITMTATNWYLLEAEVNAAGSSVTYYINGTSTGVTHVANIPTGAGREVGWALQMVKTVGATTSLLDIDAYYVELDFTTPR